jgi:hypothetical protein
MELTPPSNRGRQALPKEYHEAKAKAVAVRAKALRLKAKLQAEGKEEEAAAVEVPPSTIDPEVKAKLLTEAKELRAQKKRETWNKWYAEHRDELIAKRKQNYDAEARKAYRASVKDRTKKQQRQRLIANNHQELKDILATAPEHWKEAVLGIQQENNKGNITMAQVIALRKLVKADSPEEPDATREVLAANNIE